MIIDLKNIAQTLYRSYILSCFTVKHVYSEKKDSMQYVKVFLIQKET